MQFPPILAVPVLAVGLVAPGCGAADESTRQDFIDFIVEENFGLDEPQAECLADKLADDGRFSWTFLLNADETSADADDAVSIIGTFTFECLHPAAGDGE